MDVNDGKQDTRKFCVAPSLCKAKTKNLHSRVKRETQQQRRDEKVIIIKNQMNNQVNE